MKFLVNNKKNSKMGGLGKGLDLIFMENSLDSENTPIILKIDELEPNSNQPRYNFENSSLNELSESIIKHGVIQPIIVKPMVNGKYKIIAGERRWRASKQAGLAEIPVVVKDIDESKIMEFALVENLQRENLSALEEARGYKSLIENHNFTHEQVARSVGKSRSYITNTLRLLNLPEIIINKLEKNEISSGHARTLLSLENSNLNNLDIINYILKIVITQELSVRKLENLVKKINSGEFNITSIDKKVNNSKISSEVFESYKNKFQDEFSKKFNKKIKITNNFIKINFSGEQDFLEIYNLLFN